MSMREHYENLDQYAAYDYKDVANAYGHGEWDAIDTVLEILDEVSSESIRGGVYWNSAQTIKVLRRRIMALKEGEQE